MMKGVDVMSYAKGISRKDKKKYLKDVQKNLRLLYSQENVNDIVKIMNSSIDDFIQNNPLSTLNDFKTYVNTEDIFSDWIQNAECDEIITKIDINSTRKKRIIVILTGIVVTFILLLMTFLLGHLIMYITAQNVVTIVIN